MTRQSQSCEAVGAKCSRQSERHMQGLKPGTNLASSWEGKKAGVGEPWGGVRAAPTSLEGGRRQTVACGQGFRSDSKCSEKLPKDLGKGMA